MKYSDKQEIINILQKVRQLSDELADSYNILYSFLLEYKFPDIELNFCNASRSDDSTWFTSEIQKILSEKELTYDPQEIRSRTEVYDLYYPMEAVTVSEIEKELNIEFSSDFTEINKICSYEVIGKIDFLDFRAKSERSVLERTIFYRKNSGLHDNCLILSESSENFTVLKILSKVRSEVIICSKDDCDNLCMGRSFEYNPTIFPCFVDFYEYLLDEEEKIRQEG